MNTLQLRAYRERIGLSQRELSRQLNIAHSHYWKWEKGKTFPNAKQIVKLCSIFKCTPNDLFGIKGDYMVAFEKYDD